MKIENRETGALARSPQTLGRVRLSSRAATDHRNVRLSVFFKLAFGQSRSLQCAPQRVFQTCFRAIPSDGTS